MNKSLFANIRAIVLLVLSIVAMVLMLLFKPLDAKIVVGFFAFSILGIVIIRFAYSFARFANRRYSRWNRKYPTDPEDDEPSDFAVILTKISGYMLLVPQIIILFFPN